jgi:hypothetical protein
MERFSLSGMSALNFGLKVAGLALVAVAMLILSSVWPRESEVRAADAPAALEPTEPHFRTREEYEIWKATQPKT